MSGLSAWTQEAALRVKTLIRFLDIVLATAVFVAFT